jgi:hypothetical protein
MKRTSGYAIVKKIRSYLVMNWNVEVLNEYREANKCVDALANIGCDIKHKMIFYEDCPAKIKDILHSMK